MQAQSAHLSLVHWHVFMRTPSITRPIPHAELPFYSLALRGISRPRRDGHAGRARPSASPLAPHRGYDRSALTRSALCPMLRAPKRAITPLSGPKLCVSPKPAKARAASPRACHVAETNVACAFGEPCRGELRYNCNGSSRRVAETALSSRRASGKDAAAALERSPAPAAA